MFDEQQKKKKLLWPNRSSGTSKCSKCVGPSTIGYKMVENHCAS